MKELLGPEETVINPHYMRQLLEYGMKMAAHQGTIDVEKEAAVSVDFGWDVWNVKADEWTFLATGGGVEERAYAWNRAVVLLLCSTLIRCYSLFLFFLW